MNKKELLERLNEVTANGNDKLSYMSYYLDEFIKKIDGLKFELASSEHIDSIDKLWSYFKTSLDIIEDLKKKEFKSDIFNIDNSITFKNINDIAGSGKKLHDLFFNFIAYLKKVELIDGYSQKPYNKILFEDIFKKNNYRYIDFKFVDEPFICRIEFIRKNAFSIIARMKPSTKSPNLISDRRLLNVIEDTLDVTAGMDDDMFKASLAYYLEGIYDNFKKIYNIK